MTPYRALSWFAPLWLAGLGALAAMEDPHGHGALLGGAEVLAGVLSVIRPLRRFGWALMLVVLAVAGGLHAMRGQFAGHIIFYAAVILYLWLEDRRLARSAPSHPDRREPDTAA